MSDETYWLHFHNGKESRPLNPSICDGDVLVRVEGDEERCVTSSRFEEGPHGTYGWRASRRPEEGGSSTAKPQQGRIFGLPTGVGHVTAFGQSGH
jgi:hypothetical protein